MKKGGMREKGRGGESWRGKSGTVKSYCTAKSEKRRGDRGLRRKRTKEETGKMKAEERRNKLH